MPRAPRLGRAVSWIAEALQTGNPLAPIPTESAPRSRAEGERVAFLALAELGIPVCGVRILDGNVGPVIEGRLHPSGTPLAGLRHPRATAALVGVLGEDLAPEGDGSPALSALHPALDMADSRFTALPGSVPLRAADLAGLGHVLLGEAAASQDAVVVAGRAGPVRVEVVAAFRDVAAAARRLGGLPAGAVLVAAGLAPLGDPDGDGWIEAGFRVLGTVRARLAPPGSGPAGLGSPG